MTYHQASFLVTLETDGPASADDKRAVANAIHEAVTRANEEIGLSRDDADSSVLAVVLVRPEPLEGPDLTDIVNAAFAVMDSEGGDLMACVAKLGAALDAAFPDRVEASEEPGPMAKNGRAVVTLETGDGARVEVVARFNTITEAEAYLNGPSIDAKALHEGRYGIDTPHGVASDAEAVTLANKLGFQVFRSMGSVYYAPPGVGVTGNDSGKGWKGGFDDVAAAALAALATVEP